MTLGPVLPETQLVLDTNLLTAWRYRKTGVLSAIADYQSRLKLFPALTAITVHEALYGFENRAAKAGVLDDLTKRDRLAIEQLISSCLVLPFDQRAAEIGAYIIPRLPKNIPKQTLLDGLISATALAHGYGVATNDRDFEIIGQHTPDDLILRVDFWTP
ncbi:MAG: type II toxin-antitoxin system VapC family toxin [Pyrinomonadaceae bacterium]